MTIGESAPELNTTTAEDRRIAAAIRTLEGNGYTYHGGTAWKPPLGPRRTPMPSVDSLRDWHVGITHDGQSEVRIVLSDPEEARTWIAWMLQRTEEKNGG